MNIHGDLLERLTDTNSLDVEPSWSPDGTRIVFASDYKNSNQHDLWVMNADGTNRVKLTNNSEPTGTINPSWSPDSTMIAFVSRRDGNSDIYVMNADGTNQTRLTYEGDNSQPSPN